MLYELEKILKKKYLYYKKNNRKKIGSIEINNFYKIGIEKISVIFPFYFTGINQNYINQIVENSNNKILLSCLSDKFDIKNISSILIYHKIKLKEKIKYYILLLGTNERFRQFGYGKVILDEFIEWIKLKNNTMNKEIKIILKSVETSINFYLGYGFVQSISELKSNKLFYKYENTDELKTNQDKILEYYIK